jgi:hypothetical protein
LQRLRLPDPGPSPAHLDSEPQSLSYCFPGRRRPGACSGIAGLSAGSWSPTRTTAARPSHSPLRLLFGSFRVPGPLDRFAGTNPAATFRLLPVDEAYGAFDAIPGTRPTVTHTAPAHSRFTPDMTTAPGAPPSSSAPSESRSTSPPATTPRRRSSCYTGCLPRLRRNSRGAGLVCMRRHSNHDRESRHGDGADPSISSEGDGLAGIRPLPTLCTMT